MSCNYNRYLFLFLLLLYVHVCVRRSSSRHASRCGVPRLFVRGFTPPVSNPANARIGLVYCGECASPVPWPTAAHATRQPAARQKGAPATAHPSAQPPVSPTVCLSHCLSVCLVFCRPTVRPSVRLASGAALPPAAEAHEEASATTTTTPLRILAHPGQ